MDHQERLTMYLKFPAWRVSLGTFIEFGFSYHAPGLIILELYSKGGLLELKRHSSTVLAMFTSPKVCSLAGWRVRGKSADGNACRESAAFAGVNQ
jgi:hypothetical protein